MFYAKPWFQGWFSVKSIKKLLFIKILNNVTQVGSESDYTEDDKGLETKKAGCKEHFHFLTFLKPKLYYILVISYSDKVRKYQKMLHNVR